MLKYILIFGLMITVGGVIALTSLLSTDTGANAIDLTTNHKEIDRSSDDELSDWCIEHQVPESECTKCKPSLVESFQASGDWCAGHGLPESHCRLCNPGIVFPQEKLLQTSKSESGEGGMEVSLFFRANQEVCATNDALIQFASSRTAERAGLTTFRVVEVKRENIVEAPAEVLFDENSTSVISSSVRVLVSRWLISPGDIVEKDDSIAILQSPEIAELRARAISAAAELEVQKREMERDKSLVTKNLVTESDFERRVALYQKAQAELTGIRGLLLSSGMNNQDIDVLIESESVSNEFVFRTPVSGLIAQRIAKIGELLEDGQPLAIMTDPSSMWIEARLTDDEMKRISVGQKLLFSSDDHTLNRSSGSIIWISPYLDKHSRTGIVRANVIQADTEIRAGEFGKAWIFETMDSEATLVPKDAVQWEGCCNVVFVKETDSRFRPRKVTIADGPESFYYVTKGLSAGEVVVVDGSFLLKTELKKTSIGAGCCGIEPVG